MLKKNWEKCVSHLPHSNIFEVFLLSKNSPKLFNSQQARILRRIHPLLTWTSAPNFMTIHLIVIGDQADGPTNSAIHRVTWLEMLKHWLFIANLQCMCCFSVIYITTNGMEFFSKWCVFMFWTYVALGSDNLRRACFRNSSDLSQSKVNLIWFKDKKRTFK